MSKLIRVANFLIIILLPAISFGQNRINWLNQGDVEYKQANFELALNAYTNHIEENPDDPRGYLYRARANASLGQNVNKELDLRIAQGLNPYSHMYLDINSRINNYAKKLYDFDDSELKSSFSKSPLKYEDYVKYLELVENKHSKDSLILLTMTELSAKRLNEAAILIDQMESMDSSYALVYDLKGLLYLKRGDLKGAIHHFTTAISLSPDFALAYHNRAICHKLLGQYKKAENDLNAALELNNEISLFYFSLAKLNEKIDNSEASLDLYKKAIALDENYKEAIINYSLLLKGLGEYDLAIQNLQKAIDQNPDDYANYFLKANLHFVYGEYEDAIMNYENYLVKNTDDADAYYNLGLSNILYRNHDEGCSSIEYSLGLKTNEKREELYNSFCN